jgi:hypothetical protein
MIEKITETIVHVTATCDFCQKEIHEGENVIQNQSYTRDVSVSQGRANIGGFGARTYGLPSAHSIAQAAQAQWAAQPQISVASNPNQQVSMWHQQIYELRGFSFDKIELPRDLLKEGTKVFCIGEGQIFHLECFKKKLHDEIFAPLEMKAFT